MHNALRLIRRVCNSQQTCPHPGRQWGFRLVGYAVDDSTRSRCRAGHCLSGPTPQPAAGTVVNSIALFGCSARMQMPCNLHGRGGFVLRFAYPTEVWRSRSFQPSPAFPIPGSIESATQIIADTGFAAYPQATPPNLIHFLYIAAQPWHAISK
jgi:hypothetical protein